MLLLHEPQCLHNRNTIDIEASKSDLNTSDYYNSNNALNPDEKL